MSREIPEQEPVYQGLSKTRHRFVAGLGNLMLGKKEIGSDLEAQLESALLVADVGLDAARLLVDDTIARTRRTDLNQPQTLLRSLRAALIDLLQPRTKPFAPDLEAKPCVVLFVGVNGSGKTTTIGKLGHHLKAAGHSVLLAAGDTFRAAAAEQLRVWSQRIDAPMVSQQQGSDAAAVIFDSMQSARAHNLDIVLADTAGRLQNQKQLMNELEKISRVMARFDAAAPHETLLVLDAGTGRNGIAQIQAFAAILPLTGLIITKLDGTAKGGFVIEAAQKIALPVYYIGLGESAEDLHPFRAEAYVDALLSDCLEVA